MLPAYYLFSGSHSAWFQSYSSLELWSSPGRTASLSSIIYRVYLKCFWCCEAFSFFWLTTVPKLSTVAKNQSPTHEVHHVKKRLPIGNTPRAEAAAMGWPVPMTILSTPYPIAVDRPFRRCRRRAAASPFSRSMTGGLSPCRASMHSLPIDSDGRAWVKAPSHSLRQART